MKFGVWSSERDSKLQTPNLFLFFFPAGLARFSPTNATHRPFFLQKRAIAGTRTSKFPLFQKQQTDAEKGESDKHERDGDKEDGKHTVIFFTKISRSIDASNFPKVANFRKVQLKILAFTALAIP